MIKTTITALALLATLAATPATGHEEKTGSFTISHPWARATASSQTAGAVFMEIHNHGDTDDRLVGAASPDAERVEIHGHLRDGDVMRMRRVDGIEVPAGGTAVLAPGGFHVMLMGLKSPLFEDTLTELTLTFEKAGDIEIEVVVEAAGATGASSATGKMDHGSGPMKSR
ncbi:MAG: copper chaperone PCu(A)C [Alphaproteobacteria bacterium]|nr:copper chaperone PCu(A)C [Alphaproteobacteria bacterium]